MNKTRPSQTLMAGLAILAAGCSPVRSGNGPSSPVLVNSYEQPMLSGLRPDFNYYKDSWDNYRLARGSDAQLDAKMDACRKDPSTCTRLFRAYVDTVDVINLLPKEESTNRMVTLISLISNIAHSDPKKDNPLNVLFHKGHWLQTPTETLEEKDGSVVCGDVAALVYEAGRRTQAPGDKMSIVGGITSDGEFHTVAVAELGKVKYVLEPNQGSLDKSGFSGVPIPMFVRYDEYLKGVRVDSRGSHVSRSAFEPLFEMDEHGIKTLGGILNVVTEPLFHSGRNVRISPMEDILHPTKAMETGAIMQKISEIGELVAEDRIATQKSPIRAAKVSNAPVRRN